LGNMTIASTPQLVAANGFFGSSRLESGRHWQQLNLFEETQYTLERIANNRKFCRFLMKNGLILGLYSKSLDSYF
jgi:hypothetical protein